MAISRTGAAIAAATASALVVAAVGAVAFDQDPPTPSVNSIASSDASADRAEMASSYYGGGFYDDAAYQELYERCDPVFNAVWGPSEDELAEINAEVDEQIALLEDAGIAYEVESEGDGYRYVHPADEQDWREFEEVLEQFYEAREDDYYGPSDEDIEHMEAQNAALIAAFDDAGVAYEIFDEGDGWVHVEPTDDAGYRIMDEYYNAQSRIEFFERAEERGVDLDEATECWEDQQALDERANLLGRLPLQLDAEHAATQRELMLLLIEAFDEAGVEYERVDVPSVSFDYADEEALEVLRQLVEEHGDEYGYSSYGYEEDMVFETEAEPAPVEEPEEG